MSRTSTHKNAPAKSAVRKAIILGSTGSIGVNALRVAAQLGERCQVLELSAYGNIDRLIEQIKAFSPQVVSVWNKADAEKLRGMGMEPESVCGNAFAGRVAQEVATYSQIAKALDLKAD